MPRVFVDSELNFLDWRPGKGRTVEIVDIAVMSERRKGIGTKLIHKMLERIPEDTSVVYAITRISNEIACQFYTANGFRIVGRLHDFYRDASSAESALMFGLDL